MVSEFKKKKEIGTNLSFDGKNEAKPWGSDGAPPKRDKKRWRDNPGMAKKHKKFGPHNRGGKRGAKHEQRFKRNKRAGKGK